jgi:hypothetical protein
MNKDKTSNPEIFNNNKVDQNIMHNRRRTYQNLVWNCEYPVESERKMDTTLLVKHYSGIVNGTGEP